MINVGTEIAGSTSRMSVSIRTRRNHAAAPGLVATLGAVFGVLLAHWAVGLLVRATQALPFPLPYWVSFTIDGPVLLFTVAAALLATVVSGLIPALLSALMMLGKRKSELVKMKLMSGFA